MYLPQLDTIPRLDLLGAPTPLTYLPRLSDYLGRVIMIKRDDLTPLGLGGNKLRKLEYLAADAISQGADVLLTAGAIQSNHVRQTASVAAKLGVHCVALLETPPGTDSQLYRENGNRLLLGLSGVEVIPVANLNHPDQQLQEQAIRLEAQGFRPYIIPVGGSNVLGAMGYVACAREIAQQCEDLPPAAVVVASGSAGTHAGLAVGLQQWMPGTTLIGVTVSRKVEEQHPKVAQLTADTVAMLGVKSALPITLWDDYFAPSYGVPNEAGNDAIRLLAQLEGLYLDPVYTAKAMAGLIDGVAQQRFPEEGPVLFIHTGGVPALFAYQDFF